MRKLMFTLLATSIFSFSHELPICEEFSQEKNITCITGDKNAVIITSHKDGTKTFEYFIKGKKVYIEYNNQYVLASNGTTKLEVNKIPSEDTDRYINDVFELMFRGF